VQVRDRTSDPKALLEIANSNEVQQVALDQARAIQRDARSLAPVNTGRLRRNILIEAVTNLDTGIQGYAVGWGDRAFYGQMVEFGTEHTRPRPHLVPAAIKNGGRGFGGGR
jgi:HK97 gp10 family phage protein